MVKVQKTGNPKTLENYATFINFSLELCSYILQATAAGTPV
jgi:hypothetical protein